MLPLFSTIHGMIFGTVQQLSATSLQFLLTSLENCRRVSLYYYKIFGVFLFLWNCTFFRSQASFTCGFCFPRKRLTAIKNEVDLGEFSEAQSVKTPTDFWWGFSEITWSKPTAYFSIITGSLFLLWTTEFRIWMREQNVLFFSSGFLLTHKLWNGFIDFCILQTDVRHFAMFCARYRIKKT